MKKFTVNIILSHAVFATFTFAGCSSTPKVASRTPALTGYKFGSEPNKTTMTSEGKEFDRHVKESQKMALEHERQMAALEYRSQEVKLATEKGLPAAPERSLMVAAESKPKKGGVLSWFGRLLTPVVVVESYPVYQPGWVRYYSYPSYYRSTRFYDGVSGHYSNRSYSGVGHYHSSGSFRDGRSYSGSSYRGSTYR